MFLLELSFFVVVVVVSVLANKQKQERGGENGLELFLNYTRNYISPNIYRKREEKEIGANKLRSSCSINYSLCRRRRCR